MDPVAWIGIVTSVTLPKHFEWPYYISYNNKDTQSLIIMRLLHIVSSFNYPFYLDFSYIHALVFKETSSCFCTGAICQIGKPAYKQSFRILFSNTLCLYFANSTPLHIEHLQLYILMAYYKAVKQNYMWYTLFYCFSKHAMGHFTWCITYTHP